MDEIPEGVLIGNDFLTPKDLKPVKKHLFSNIFENVWATEVQTLFLIFTTFALSIATVITANRRKLWKNRVSLILTILSCAITTISLVLYLIIIIFGTLDEETSKLMLWLCFILSLFMNVAAFSYNLTTNIE